MVRCLPSIIFSVACVPLHAFQLAGGFVDSGCASGARLNAEKFCSRRTKKKEASL
jgi:hypothetical protein